jgi:hypothetical protein
LEELRGIRTAGESIVVRIEIFEGVTYKMFLKMRNIS